MEIERKFVIKKVDVDKIQNIVAIYDIEQIYLDYGEDVRIRERRNIRTGEIEYFYTEKNDVEYATRDEKEKEIDENEYSKLYRRMDRSLSPIYKRRYVVNSEGSKLELDYYTFWTSQAIMEIELGQLKEDFKIPKWIKIIKEVTGDKRYSNKGLAKNQGVIR